METWPTDIAKARSALSELFACVDMARYDTKQAQRALRHVAAMEAMCAAMKGRLAQRVAETTSCTGAGQRSPAHLVGRLTGTTVGDAARSLETAKQLESLPRAAEAFARGRLSPVKARELAAAASEVPDAEDDLLLAAPDEDAGTFTKRCRRVRASVHSAEERHRRAHAGGFVREWTDDEDRWNLTARGTKTDGARIMAAIKAHADRIFAETRRAGTERSAPEAYRFDALLHLTTRDAAEGSGPRAHVHVNVDAEALLSLTGLAGATCEIPGLGTIPVAEARKLLGDALLTILVKKGRDVTTVAHHGRTVPVHVRRAVLAKHPECVVEGCTVRDHLNLHHLLPWAENPVTTVDNVVPLCDFDHDLHHYEGFTLEPLDDGTDTYRLVPPAVDEPVEERAPP